MAARMSKIPATDTPTMRITLLVIGWLGVQVPSSAPICCGHRPPAGRMSRRWALGASASRRYASWQRPELNRESPVAWRDEEYRRGRQGSDDQAAIAQLP